MNLLISDENYLFAYAVGYDSALSTLLYIIYDKTTTLMIVKFRTLHLRIQLEQPKAAYKNKIEITHMYCKADKI
ncbi:hypothetical protein T09_1005 [Trichinella sp. T9]|nr:hypothetical protein T09_1005 [Trichinella sp. T9]